jgi:hypothetical protein
MRAIWFVLATLLLLRRRHLRAGVMGMAFVGDE